MKTSTNSFIRHGFQQLTYWLEWYLVIPRKSPGTLQFAGGHIVIETPVPWLHLKGNIPLPLFQGGQQHSISTLILHHPSIFLVVLKFLWRPNETIQELSALLFSIVLIKKLIPYTRGGQLFPSPPPPLQVFSQ